MKEFNDVTAAPYLVFFFATGSREKDTENGAAVTSLRSFLFRDDFMAYVCTEKLVLQTFPACF